MSLKFNKAFFITSSLAEADFPIVYNSHGTPLLEIALVGRSNVGKSSLINHLLRRQNLAKVSTTPGKTQTINFFNVDDKICLVDLPGYGFARVPKALRTKWAKSIDAYLRTRSTLKLLILLLDCRRIPSDEDIELILWAHVYKKPIIIVFTKFDKLRAKERKAQKERILHALQEATPIENFTTLTYSIKNSHMRQVLINTINDTLKILPAAVYETSF